MVKTRFRYFFLVALPFFLSACIETKNVSTFAGSVTVVTDATSKMIDSDRVTCANINVTIGEIEALPKIGMGKIGSANCTGAGKVLDAIAGVNKVLANYGKALGDVSQDTFINYDSDVSTLQGILKSLPADYQPTADQITAVSGLAGWVASLVTEEKRERAIKDATVGNNGEMTTNFHNVVALLQHLATNYSDGLEANAQITKDFLILIPPAYGANEPVAVEELKNRLAGNTQVSDDQKAAIKQYVSALQTMSKAFDAATAEPTAKELLPEVRDFAKQARSVYQSFAKAFPHS
jgi:hypothetical protein